MFQFQPAARSQNSTLPTMTSISRPVTVEDEEGARAYNKMARPVSPPIENVINSFNQELDHLTKSLDDVLSTRYRSSPDENRQYSSFSTAQKPPPLKHVLDPPPSLDKVSPLHSGLESTPARSRTSRYASSSTARPPMSTTPARSVTRSASTRAEPPPPPVETPAYNLFPSSSTNYRRCRESRREDTSRDNFESRRDEKMNTGLNREDKLDNSRQDALEKMRVTLAQQDQRILELERENKDLRHELQSSRAPPQSYRSEPRPYRADASSSPYREDPRSYKEEPSPYRQEEPARMYPREQELPSIQPYREEPMGRTPMTASSTFRTSPHTPLGPPNRNSINLLSSPADDPFSPGTKFVAELARLLTMEEGHHAPLSVILDKHWDQLQYHFGN
jgi:hypothetical protein